MPRKTISTRGSIANGTLRELCTSAILSRLEAACGSSINPISTQALSMERAVKPHAQAVRSSLSVAASSVAEVRSAAATPAVRLVGESRQLLRARQWPAAPPATIQAASAPPCIAAPHDDSLQELGHHTNQECGAEDDNERDHEGGLFNLIKYKVSGRAVLPDSPQHENKHFSLQPNREDMLRRTARLNQRSCQDHRCEHSRNSSERWIGFIDGVV
mmetsp:Transcript_39321/g.69170  ORF Transcript_39321/g.69170 Transcript_39321/m.69170 type:complete len:216 (+) Transcript_39321:1502-2149(+)